MTGADIVRIARAQIGKHEVPMGSNTGPFVLACQHTTFLGGTGWPWCAAFVCWVAKQAGVPLAYNSAGAWDLLTHHQPSIDPAKAKPGMVVAYTIGTGHTGILTGVDLKARTVTSCDGNWSDAVVEHTMALSEVRGIWAIPGVSYESAPPVPPVPAPKRLPAWVVTTSANGHSKVLFTTHSKKRLINWMQRHVLARVAPNGITIHRGPAK